jgi:hypothetical protein
MLYKGSCHCGACQFEVEGELTGAVACNCSICSRRASLLWCVPRHSLRLLTPQEGLATYTFNRHAIAHRFCRTCGIHPYGEDVPMARTPRADLDGSGELMVYVNLRCLENLDVAAVPVQEFDGRSM